MEPSADLSRLPKLPKAAQQIAILRYLADLQRSTGLGHTPRLKRAIVAQALGIAQGTAHTQIYRLTKSGYLETLDNRAGRGDAGSVYRVPAHFVGLLEGTHVQLYPSYVDDNRQQQPATTGNNNRQQQPATRLRSSSSFITTTTDSRAQAHRLAEACTRLALAEHGISANDLLSLLRNEIFSEESELLESIEHIAFYLRTDAAKSIKSPKAWVMSQLRQGYYAAPADFMSWEECQQAARIESKRAKLARLAKLQREEIELDFELWLAELPTNRREELLGVLPVGGQSPAVRAILKQAFLAETHRHELLADEDSDV